MRKRQPPVVVVCAFHHHHVQDHWQAGHAMACLVTPMGGRRDPRERDELEVLVAGQDFDGQMTDAFREMSRGTLVERMGIELLEVSAERVVGTMPVKGNTQPYGLLHGGASCVLAESLGSLGAALHAGPGRAVMGIEIGATHHRGAREGKVTGVATLVHGGRTLATYEVVITDESGRRICTCRLTCLVRDTVPGGPAPGATAGGAGPAGA